MRTFIWKKLFKVSDAFAKNVCCVLKFDCIFFLGQQIKEWILWKLKLFYILLLLLVKNFVFFKDFNDWCSYLSHVSLIALFIVVSNTNLNSSFKDDIKLLAVGSLLEDGLSGLIKLIS